MNVSVVLQLVALSTMIERGFEVGLTTRRRSLRRKPTVSDES